MSAKSNIFGLNPGQNILLVNSVEAVSSDIVEEAKCLRNLVSPNGSVKVENAGRLSQDDHKSSSFDVILSGIINPRTIIHTNDLLGIYMNAVKPQGRVVLQQVVSTIDSERSEEAIASYLKLSGFVHISVPKKLETQGEEKIIQIEGHKPNFEVGSSAKINFGSVPDSVAAVWKLDDTLDDDIINADELLDESDLKKPDLASLKVCGTTGKRKACKNCSCGLAEELDQEAKGAGEPAATTKSACGNCSLGDAFRCASCPYLGMPAFKPGEKIQLSGIQLKADV